MMNTPAIKSNPSLPTLGTTEFFVLIALQVLSIAITVTGHLSGDVCAVLNGVLTTVYTLLRPYHKGQQIEVYQPKSGIRTSEFLALILMSASQVVMTAMGYIDAEWATTAMTVTGIAYKVGRTHLKRVEDRATVVDALNKNKPLPGPVMRPQVFELGEVNSK